MRAEKETKYCRNEFSPSRLLFGLLIIFFGFLILAKNTGWLDRYYYFNLDDIWPILIILAGISLLRFRSWWANALLFIFTLIVFIAIVGITLTGGKGLGGQGSGGESKSGLEKLGEVITRSQ